MKKRDKELQKHFYGILSRAETKIHIIKREYDEKGKFYSNKEEETFFIDLLHSAVVDLDEIVVRYLHSMED